MSLPLWLSVPTCGSHEAACSRDRQADRQPMPGHRLGVQPGLPVTHFGIDWMFPRYLSLLRWSDHCCWSYTCERCGFWSAIQHARCAQRVALSVVMPNKPSDVKWLYE